jgi:two-component system chemotaxis response regulator CheY
MSIKILIVDDAAFIREALTIICKDAGYHVVAVARNGKEAVDFANKYKPDLIIMDMVLPELNGIQASQEILKENPNINIIACSTVDQNFVIKKALEAGCQSYIEKPFNKKSVLEVIALTTNRKKIQGGQSV